MPVDISGILSALGQFGQANKTDADRIMQAQQARGGMLGALGSVGGMAAGTALGGPAGGAIGGALGSTLGHSLAGGGAGMSGAGPAAVAAAQTGYQIGQQEQQQQAQGALGNPATPAVPAGAPTPGAVVSPATASILQGGALSDMLAPQSEGAAPAPEGTQLPDVPGQAAVPGTPGGVLSPYYSSDQLSKMSPQLVGELMKAALPTPVSTGPGVTTRAVSQLGLSQGDPGGVIAQGGSTHPVTPDQIDEYNNANGTHIDRSIPMQVTPEGKLEKIPGASVKDVVRARWVADEDRIASGDVLTPRERATHEADGQTLTKPTQWKDDQTGEMYTQPPMNLEPMRAQVRGNRPVAAENDMALPGTILPKQVGTAQTKVTPEEMAAATQPGNFNSLFESYNELNDGLGSGFSGWLSRKASDPTTGIGAAISEMGGAPDELTMKRALAARMTADAKAIAEQRVANQEITRLGPFFPDPNEDPAVSKSKMAVIKPYLDQASKNAIWGFKHDHPGTALPPALADEAKRVQYSDKYQESVIHIRPEQVAAQVARATGKPQTATKLSSQELKKKYNLE